MQLVAGSDWHYSKISTWATDGRKKNIVFKYKIKQTYFSTDGVEFNTRLSLKLHHITAHWYKALRSAHFLNKNTKKYHDNKT